MGLFSRAPAEPLDDRLASTVPDKDNRLRKIVAREQAAILGALRPGETVGYITRCETGVAVVVHFDAAVVATNQRLLVVRKGKVEALERDEITKAGMPYETDVHKYRVVVIAERSSRSYMIDIEDRDRAAGLLRALGYDAA